jgi:hypothetical protein
MNAHRIVTIVRLHMPRLYIVAIEFGEYAILKTHAAVWLVGWPATRWIQSTGMNISLRECEVNAVFY